MDIRAAALAEIDTFLRRRNMSESAFGRRAVNDHKFVRRLRTGNVTLDRLEKARAFIAAQNGADSAPPPATTPAPQAA